MSTLNKAIEIAARVIQMSLATRVKQADAEEHAAVVKRMPEEASQLERLGNYQRARTSLAHALMANCAP